MEIIERNYKIYLDLCWLYKCFLPLQRQGENILYSLGNKKSMLVFPLTMKQKTEMKWPVPIPFLWCLWLMDKENGSNWAFLCILSAVPSALSLLTKDKGSKIWMRIWARLVRDYPTIPFLWKKSQMCKIRMGFIFLAFAVRVLSKLQSGFASCVCFLQPPKTLMQGWERMVDKLISTECCVMWCVRLLLNSTNLLNREIKRLLHERVSCTMVSLFTDSASSPLPKKEGWQCLTFMYFWNNKIDLTPPTCQPHLKRVKYIFQIHILRIPQGIKDKLLFPLHTFFSSTP